MAVTSGNYRKGVLSSWGFQQVCDEPGGILTVEGRDGFRAVASKLELKAKNKMRYKETFSKYARKQNLWRLWYLVPPLLSSTARG
jgi:hypothetical protein